MLRHTKVHTYLDKRERERERAGERERESVNEKERIERENRGIQKKSRERE